MSNIVRWIVFPVVACALALTPVVETASASPKGKALHKQALEAFKDGNYVKAKKLWEKAYQLDREPKYLYNLARLGQEMDRPVMALENFEKFLELTGTRAGEVSEDGRYTVIEAECLGACGFATVVQVNDRYFENVTPESVPEVLAQLEQGESEG